MRRLLVAAAFVLVLAPTFKRGSGSGEDDRGAYNYDYLLIRAARWTVEIEWWPET